MQFSATYKKILYFSLTAIILLRLFSLGIYELADTTESRYASIAMRMVLQNDWITPHYFDQPFWGKPPLSFWATAISFKIFGICEFSARLPHLLMMIGVLGLIFSTLKKTSKNLAILSCAIFASMAAWLVLAGSVMTEASLVLGLAVAMFSFYKIEVLRDDSKLNGYLFFIGLAICMLAKGPVGVVICGIALATYLFKQYGAIAGIAIFYKKMPIFGGLALASAIFVPWYVIAEYRTPGFLNYFIFGEHFGRFFVSGWAGDRYGHAHQQPLGMIWGFFLMTTTPWSIYLLYKFFAAATKKQNYCQSNIKLLKASVARFFDDKSNFYFFAWALAPLLLFTFAHNIIASYSLLAALPFSILFTKLLIAENLQKKSSPNLLTKDWPAIKFFMTAIPILLLLLMILVAFKRIGYHSSDKEFVIKFQNSGKEIFAVYSYGPEHSTYFYSRDKIKILHDEAEFGQCRNCFIVVDIPATNSQFSRLQSIATNNNSMIINEKDAR